MGPLVQCRALNPRSTADTPSVRLFASQLKRVTDHAFGCLVVWMMSNGSRFDGPEYGQRRELLQEVSST
jgi:hypothetical protein